MICYASDPLLAQIDWQPLWEDHGIPLAVMGLIVVFVALTLLRIFIGWLPKIIAILDRFFPEADESAPSELAKDALWSELPDEILVVITAAVAAVVVEPHRIVHTRSLSPEDLSWSLEGRMQHHASHRIQPRKSG